MSMVIAAFSDSLFHILTSVSNTNTMPFLYLKEPTKYGKYLRQVLMAWIMSENICVENIIPLEYLADTVGLQYSAPASDSDDDFGVVTLKESTSVTSTSDSIKKSIVNRFHCSICDSS